MQAAVIRRAIVAGALLMGLTGCDDRWSRLDPPRIVQLSCAAKGSDDAMVFSLDLARGQARWVNGPGDVRGTLAASEEAYRIDGPASVRAHAFAARINRYDGAMVHEFGKPPFLAADGRLRSGNVRRTLRCVAQTPGPKL